MKRMLAIVITVAMVVSFLAACAPNNEPAPDPAPADETAEEQEPEPVTEEDDEPAPAPEGTRNIVFWDMIWAEAGVYDVRAQALVDEFNATNEYGIYVTYQSIPWDGWFQTFITAVTSGNAPDVSTGAFMHSIMMADMGEGLPLDPIVEAWREEGGAIIDDINPDIFNLFMFEGRYYGLPWNIVGRQFFYRTDMFEEAGITELPTTWDEFLEVCAQLREHFPDVVPLALPIEGPGGFHTLFNLLQQNGTGITDAAGNPAFDTDEVREVLEFVHALAANGFLPEGAVAYDHHEALRLFLAGGAAMYHHGPIDIRDFPELEGNVAVLPIMLGPSADAPRASAWPNAIQAYAQTEDPEAALIFIRWWLENQLPLFTDTGLNFPVRASWLEDPHFTENWQPRQTAEYIMPFTVSPVWPAPNPYLEFSTIDAEAFLGIALERSVLADPDFDAIMQEIQDYLLGVFAEFQ